MDSRFITVCTAVLLLGWMALAAYGQSSPTPKPASELPLFAIEIRIGPTWNPDKPPHEQVLFAEHSANLQRMREADSLLLGARYSDKGLIVVTAPTQSAVEAMMDGDPSIAAGTFSFEVYPFSVFYPGSIPANPPR